LPQFNTDGGEREIFHTLNTKNILTDRDNIKIPSKWKDKGNVIRSKTKLARIRREERIPDPSFDLNGDGTVSAHEYAIAKMFDFDFDNKLNPQEKANCLKKLKNGFERSLYWDADQGQMRIIQKDGNILLPDSGFGLTEADEDGMLLGKTYPFLKQQRVDERKSLNNKIFENFLQKEQVKKGILENMCEVHVPKAYTSRKITLSDNKEKLKNQHRLKAGLSAEPHDEKLLRKDPSMEFINSPNALTYTELQKKRVNSK